MANVEYQYHVWNKTSNSNVDPRIMYINNGGAEVLVTNISISSKNRMMISTLFMKFNLNALVKTWSTYKKDNVKF